MSDLVSIITPSYNSAQFIKQTIESVINQTYQDWELLITDDNSNDNSVQVIQEYVDKDTRIKLFILSENQGAAVARNNSLQYAKGRFIAFIDSDDLWLPEKLEKQIRFIKEKNVAICFTSYGLIEERGKSLHKTIHAVDSIDYYGYLKNTIIGMSTSLIDITKTGTFQFVNMRTRQDAVLWMTLLKAGNTAKGLDKVLTMYRVRHDSISANKIKAAKKVWDLYYNHEKLGLLCSIYYFSCYIFNAIKKRL